MEYFTKELWVDCKNNQKRYIINYPICENNCYTFVIGLKTIFIKCKMY